MRPLVIALGALAVTTPAQAAVFPRPGHYGGKDYLGRRVRFTFVQNTVRVSLDGFELRHRVIMRRVPVRNGAFDATRYGLQIKGHWDADGHTVGKISYRGRYVVWSASWESGVAAAFHPATGHWTGSDSYGRSVAFDVGGGRVTGFRLGGRSLFGGAPVLSSRFSRRRYGATVSGRFPDAASAGGTIGFGGRTVSWTARPAGGR